MITFSFMGVYVMSKLDDYYAYKVTTSGSGGGGDGCLTLFFAILVCVVPWAGIPILIICLIIDSFRKKY